MVIFHSYVSLPEGKSSSDKGAPPFMEPQNISSDPPAQTPRQPFGKPRVTASAWNLRYHSDGLTFLDEWFSISYNAII